MTGDFTLADIAICFEGLIPSSIATVGPGGMPNITYLSVVHMLDQDHVALSRQFFKKTENNTQANPFAQVGLIDPMTGRLFRIHVEYTHTETSGSTFEKLSNKLDAVAAYEGMENVFKLKGVDVCKVHRVELVPCDFPEGSPPPAVVGFEKVEEITSLIAAAGDIDELLSSTLRACRDALGYDHAFVMLADETGERLYTVASLGFPSSGAGSEVQLGDGPIGVAAQRHQAIRINHMTRDRAYSQAARIGAGLPALERIIPLPGLPGVESQLIVPMLAARKLVGVLCFQSEQVGAFQSAHECIASILANQLAMALFAMRVQQEPSPAPVPAVTPSATGKPVQVKHYAEDDSVFFDNEYLIKGVAGGILWRLLRMYAEEQRTEFSNKEIRLDQSLELPDIKDNLEARLILLRKRLEERSEWLRIEKTARGRFRLVATRPVSLVAMEGGGPL